MGNIGGWVSGDVGGIGGWVSGVGGVDGVVWI